MKTPGRIETTFQLVMWQGLWFALVLTATDAVVACSAAAVAILAAAIRARPWTMRVLAIALAATACGLVVDGILLHGALVGYAGRVGALPPAWILALWALFGTVISLPMRRLLADPRIAALAGLVGGPLAYAGGARLGAIAFPSGETAGLAATAIGYALASAGLSWLAGRLLPLQREGRQGVASAQVATP